MRPWAHTFNKSYGAVSPRDRFASSITNLNIQVKTSTWKTDLEDNVASIISQLAPPHGRLQGTKSRDTTSLALTTKLPKPLQNLQNPERDSITRGTLTNGHVVMNDTQATVKRHLNCHCCLCHRVHRRRHQRGLSQIFIFRAKIGENGWRFHGTCPQFPLNSHRVCDGRFCAICILPVLTTATYSSRPGSSRA